MTIAGSLAKRLALYLFALFLSGLAGSSAIAQHYEGCFVNGQQVSDAMCSGGGTASSGGSLMSNPMYGTLMSTSRALGAAIVKSLMSPPPQGGGSAAHASSSSQSMGLNNDGVALFDQHRVGEAVEKFRQSVALDPTNAVAQGNYWQAKAALDHQNGNDELALSDVNRALGFNPQFPAAQADKSYYEDLLARKNSDADARALADHLSQQAADT